MAKVWFVRREGDEWIAPGRQPAYEGALSALIFRLDLGPQRLLVDERPKPAPNLPPEEPSQLTKVIVETMPADLDDEFTWFQVGFYDSPYSPAEVARRLDAVRPVEQ
jgi:hypothetical protein